MQNPDQTNNLKKSKQGQPKPDLDPNGSEDLTDLVFDPSKPPKLKSTNSAIAEKLDQVLDEKADKTDLSQLVAKDDVKKLNDDLRQHDHDIKKQLTDQTSKTLAAVSSSHDIGFQQGITERVDTLSQKYSGLEANINVREKKLDQKTQQYIAKLVDINEIGKYLQSYVHTINHSYVPTEQNLILAMKRGIDVHADVAAQALLKELNKLTGKSLADVIHDGVYQELEKNRDEATQAKLDAKLCAKAAKYSVQQFYHQTEDLKRFEVVMLATFLVSWIVVALTPGWWKILSGACVLAMDGLAVLLLKLWQRHGD